MHDGEHFREIARNVDEWLFRRPHALDPDELRTVRAFTFEQTTLIWTEICGEEGVTTFRRFPANHWIQDAVATGPNWYTHWNKQDYPDPVVEFLVSHLHWGPDASVMLVMDDRYSYLLPWSAYLASWKAFVYDEDGMMLTLPNENAFAYFGDDGVIYVGKRPDLSTIDE